MRVARTCRVMGIATVAVYSEADRGALHTRVADEAVAIGPAEAARSYLDIDALVGRGAPRGRGRRPSRLRLPEPERRLRGRGGRARASPSSARPAAVHRRMGDKKGARRLMAAAGVPVVPGYDGDDQADATPGRARRRASAGPVMIKPSRGGGGKGMRVVRAAEEFGAALAGSRREAQGRLRRRRDGARALRRAAAPRRGAGAGRRARRRSSTCSSASARSSAATRRWSRRRRARPSTPERARALCAAGVAAARAAGYVNAGTVEFLLDPDGAFYFLEMNTRLQVEHPVTECVTGLDLVRLQIEVAAGRPLPIAQRRRRARAATRSNAGSTPKTRGAATCLRPGASCTSRRRRARASASTAGSPPAPRSASTTIRCWRRSSPGARDRAESIERMADALARTVVLGVVTNLARLQAIVAHPAFRAGDAAHRASSTSTSPDSRAPDCPPPARWPRRRARRVAAGVPRPGRRAGARRADPWADARRLEARAPDAPPLRDDARARRRRPRVVAGDGRAPSAGGAGFFVCATGDAARPFHCVRDGDDVHLFWRGAPIVLHEETEAAPRTAPRRGRPGGAMPGKVIAVKVAPGDAVTQGRRAARRRGDEDGERGPRAARRRREVRGARRSARWWRRGRCWWSWTNDTGRGG